MIKGFEKKPAAFAAEVRNTAEEHSLEELIEKARSDQDAISAYAAVFLAVQKGLKLTPFDTQIMAGGFLDDENIAELATGEGKTIVAVFAAFMSVCRGEHVHSLTFNDYLAKRDREWMKPVYDLLGVSTAYITEKTSRDERRAAYKADVLYSTVKECGFDFLRDFLVFPPDEPVAGNYEKVIVDEADSLLIDEARIPMIAAGVMDVDKDEELPDIFDFAKSLSDEDHDSDESTGSAFLTPSGEKKAEKHFGLENIYDEENNDLLSKLNDCLRALYVLTEDKDYIVKDGAVRIIDAFTGRVAENRSYPGTLQSAVELKHGLDVSERGVIMGSIPVQFFLRQYKSIAGMTGTAMSAKDEFAELYGLIVKHIDPNTPSRREDLPMAVYYDEESKLKAVTAEIKKAHEKKQPVLVGTADIAQSEKLSALLKAEGIEHNVLNAKNDELEAEIIKNAGMPGAVTVSTNMAGRGVDIKLGGADEKCRDEAVEAGGLYAIGTFLAESARINDQLRGRSARQGDPGQSRLFVSLDEPIMKICKLKKLVGASRYPDPTEDEITEKTVIKEVSRLQNISQNKTLDERVR
ncbi:MAG: preprotein translocase subunit SecA, partial [Clostridia bacterium]|nr:preprotein translocase subunit SecA [Clostridia bacterium]